MIALKNCSECGTPLQTYAERIVGLCYACQSKSGKGGSVPESGQVKFRPSKQKR